MLKLLIALLIFSLLNDLSKDVDRSLVHPTHSYYDQVAQSFQVKSYNVKPNDTFESIIFEFNDRDAIDLSQAISDFYALNPKANHKQLNVFEHYLFPKY